MQPTLTHLLLAASVPLTMAAPAPAPDLDIETRDVNVTSRATGPEITINAFSAQMDLWNGNNKCSGNDWAGVGRPDGVCYPLNTKSLWVRSLNRDRGCRFVRVFSNAGCSGGSADLGDTKRCWDVSTRKSFQIYC